MKHVNVWRLAAGAILIAGAVSLFAAGSAGAASSQVTVAGISSAKLASLGVTLTPPNRQPATTQGDALVATRLSEGGDFASQPAVRQVVLAHVVRTTPRIECLCWVVSLDTSGYQVMYPFAGARQAAYTFYVAYVDAVNGRWLFTDAGN